MKKYLFISLFIIAGGLFLFMASYFFFPLVTPVKEGVPPKTAFMKYREAQWRKEGKQVQLVRRWIPLGEISPFLIKAVIIAEDDKFWQHEGFDFAAMQGAITKYIKKGAFKHGGSTISQQLAKNLFLSPEKTLTRKLKEAILTWRLERALSKKRIIELYLNVAEWGEGIFGIEAASRHYFDKGAAFLSAREAARLAAVLPNPRRFSPIGDSKYVEMRAERIYQIMVRRNMVIPEYEELINHTLPEQVEASAITEKDSENPRDEPMSGTRPAEP